MPIASESVTTNAGNNLFSCTLRYTTILLLSLALWLNTGYGQTKTDTASPSGFFPDTLHKGRLNGVLLTQAALYSAAVTSLSLMWYKDYSQSSFHFYNDNSSWLQMDKGGHMFSAYYLSDVMYLSYRWAGMDRKKAILYGSLLAYSFQLNLEILDGFSSYWGFSWGDLVANTAGCMLFAGQQLAWNEQRFVIKYSYHPTDYPKYNHAVLGTTLVQNLWKDYNGMTFWLSGNISSFLPEKSKFPKWLNVAFGYSGKGLGVYGTQGPQYRQFFLSLDADLTRIPTRSKPLKALFYILNLIKIPFPALEYNTTGQVKLHYFHF